VRAVFFRLPPALSERTASGRWSWKEKKAAARGTTLGSRVSVANVASEGANRYNKGPLAPAAFGTIKVPIRHNNKNNELLL